eukprot:15435059-Alexandrium_andersonii.AAC.1
MPGLSLMLLGTCHKSTAQRRPGARNFHVSSEACGEVDCPVARGCAWGKGPGARGGRAAERPT